MDERYPIYDSNGHPMNMQAQMLNQTTDRSENPMHEQESMTKPSTQQNDMPMSAQNAQRSRDPVPTNILDHLTNEDLTHQQTLSKTHHAGFFSQSTAQTANNEGLQHRTEEQLKMRQQHIQSRSQISRSPFLDIDSIHPDAFNLMIRRSVKNKLDCKPLSPILQQHMFHSKLGHRRN